MSDDEDGRPEAQELFKLARELADELKRRGSAKC